MKRKISSELLPSRHEGCERYAWQIGVDEAGRGPLFGRVYAAAVLLSEEMSLEGIKDSKKFSSAQRLALTADRIKREALAWGVAYETEATIDRVNVLRATQRAMHGALDMLFASLRSRPRSSESEEAKGGEEGDEGEAGDLLGGKVCVLVDGDCFERYMIPGLELTPLACELIPKGDGKLAQIAAASILAKHARDAYIGALCAQYPALETYYRIGSCKGYATRAHMDAVAEYGPTIFHRLTFQRVKEFVAVAPRSAVPAELAPIMHTPPPLFPCVSSSCSTFDVT